MDAEASQAVVGAVSQAEGLQGHGEQKKGSCGMVGLPKE